MIDSDFLKELDRFNLALKKNSVGINEGEQKSSYTGEGMVFKDHKKYVPGDDIRRMDWKAYARTNQFYVRRFEKEKNVTLHILVDRSSSMDYGNPNKYEYAGKMGLAIAYMASNTNDRFRYSVFSETITDISSARRNPEMAEMVDTLNNLRKTPESLIEECVTEYSKRIQNKSSIIIISDFLTDTEGIESSLKRLKNIDTVLVNVFDRKELRPDINGDKILRDPESGSKIRAYLTKRSKKDYRHRLDEHTGRIEELADMYGAEYIKVSTGEDFFDSFISVWKALNQ